MKRVFNKMEKKPFEWSVIEEEIPKTSNLRKNGFLKNKKLLSVLLLAFISTLIQVIFLKSCHVMPENGGSNSKYAVVVSRNSILQGETLSEENTKLVYLDLAESKQKFILNQEFKKYVGHKVKMNIEENTPILKDFVIKNMQDLSLPEKIPPGKRFYSLDVDLGAIASMLQVGDKVDIIAHMNIDGYGRATETILNRIKVIGIGNSFEEKSINTDANTLSFYLTPEEVKIISFMKSYSQFTVALRNPNDNNLSNNEAITFNKFIQNEKIQKIFQNDSFKIIQGKN
ncbi:MAG: Flp pilus assembly protein CpaB [Bdellovibrionota bacterium]